MKLAIEISPFTRSTSGIYRYSANLVKAIRRLDPALEITPVSFSDTVGLAPTVPKEFKELFGHCEIPLYDEVEPRFGKSDPEFIGRKSTQFHRAYHRYRVQLRQQRDCRSVRLRWTKLKREACGALARTIDRLRILPFKNVRHAVLTEETDVLHSLFDAVPKTSGGVRSRVICQTVHDVVPLLFEHSYVGYYQEILDSARNADLILAVSECTKRDLLKFGGFHADNIVVTPLAVAEEFRPMSDESVAEIRKKIGVEAGVAYFLSVSTFHPRKNFPFLLRAFRKLIAEQDCPPCRLVLTGARWGGKAEQEILELIEELGSDVIYTGFVSDDELAALYTGATSFLFPSLYEGFGLTPLEAMACGTPVICSNTSSLPEVVGDAGTLLDPTDEAAWISAIRDALNRTSVERAAASQTAIARAAQFSWEKTAQLTLNAYREALAKKASTEP